MKEKTAPDNSASAQDSEAGPKYVLTDLTALSSLVSHIPCTKCSFADLEFVSNEHLGFSHKIALQCKNCKFVNSSTYSSQRISDPLSTRPEFDVNRRVTKAFCATSGRGYSGMENFAMVMNMEVLTSTSFNKLSHKLHLAGQVSARQSLERVREDVRQAHRDLDPSIELGDIINIAVSFDGSWHKRGFTSIYGLGCVIDLLTGYVIDYEVLSKYCQQCSIAKKDLGEKSDKFNLWFKDHKENCSCNYSGSSPAMEVNVADILWKRSESLQFRYTTLLSDGDAKTFNHLVANSIYGPNIPLQKEECVNHISKRLGTALRNIVKESGKSGITLGGKRKGGLTGITITKLTRYYGNAIRNKDNCGSVQDMKTAIFATLSHCMSTDTKPQHTRCPDGPTSWCFYQRALANKCNPGSHDENIHTPLAEQVVAKIMPAYQRLASDSLLERCMKGRTQNANESLHSLIWRKCPKVTFVSKRRVDDAVGGAVAEFNFGCHAVIPEMLDFSSISPGDQTKKLARRKDVRRVKRSTLRASKGYEQKRRCIRLALLRSEEEKKQEEGCTYAPGSF